MGFLTIIWTAAQPYLLWIKLALYAAAISAVFYAGWTINDWRWEAAIAKQKSEAATLWQEKAEAAIKDRDAQMARVLALEKTNGELKDARDRAYADARRAAIAAGGLRDPGRWSSGGCPVPSAPTPASVVPEGASSGGVLSAEASDFLFEFAHEADNVLGDLRTCHEDALKRMPK